MRIPSLPLAHASIPALGYGIGTAWFRCKMDQRPALISSVIGALDAGFRHIDEAEMYQSARRCPGFAARMLSML
jgi:diketogulonate reductase-like aldo/keto reductase